jgi:peroxiredoxin
MRTLYYLSLFILLQSSPANSAPGQETDSLAFSLLDVEGNTVALADYKDAKGVIVVFTCNTCPFSRAYEERLIQINRRYGAAGFPLVAINPNPSDRSPGDSPQKMKEKANEKGYIFPYLKDEDGEVSRAYGASRTPQVFLLTRKGAGFKIVYSGAIDDNALDAGSVTQRYLENAIRAVLQGVPPHPASSKAIGSMIKKRRSS